MHITISKNKNYLFRCENYQPNDYLEIRLLRMEKAKELLDRRALELQRLM